MTNKESLEELSSLEASVRSVSNPKPDVLVPNKVAAGEASGTGKNAIAKLNEIFPGPKAPQYKITSQTGPPNNPTFFMVCCIKEQTFLGEGKSKKEAKLAC